MHKHNIKCPERPIACPNQGCDLSVKQKDWDDHMKSFCFFRAVDCSANCGESIPFIKQEDHLENNCVKRIIST